MAGKDLSRLLRPRSIAVLGSVWAENVIAQCAKMGFAGPVWPVHPTKASISGLPAYARLADLPFRFHRPQRPIRLRHLPLRLEQPFQSRPHEGPSRLLQ